MPDLDVSFMLSDPMLSDLITVTRRADTVDQKGREQVRVEQVSPNISAVITQEPPDLLHRTPEDEMVPRKIFGATSFAVRGASSGKQPDIITWAGSDYLVIQVLPYSRFGGGTYEFVAQTFTATDPAVDENT